MRTDVAGGVSLSTSMARHDRVFPRLMIAMIRAGEAGGMIDSALDTWQGELPVAERKRSLLPALALAASV